MNTIIKIILQLLGICFLAISLPVLLIIGLSAMILSAIPLALFLAAVICFAVTE